MEIKKFPPEINAVFKKPIEEFAPPKNEKRLACANGNSAYTKKPLKKVFNVKATAKIPRDIPNINSNFLDTFIRRMVISV